MTTPAAVPLLLAFAAHPDDVEFACGGVIAQETRPPHSRPAHVVICSRGESATNGSAEIRMAEARASAGLLGASVEFIDLGPGSGDAQLECRTAHILALAALVRRHRPAILLAPSVVANQHPDHACLGVMVRDAARLARYGGLEPLRAQPPHAVSALLFYAITPDAEPRDITPVLVDVSDAAVMATWTAAMQAHASQLATRNYVDLQLARARMNGLRAGVAHAIPLFPADPLVTESLTPLTRTARSY